MYNLLRRKIALTGLGILLFSLGSIAQFGNIENLPEHDDKPFHFGINMGYNQSHFSFTHHPRFLQYDTIQTVESVNSSGINLAFLVNKRII